MRCEIVANELDHRIRNLFTLVNGLISLSVRGKLELKPLADTLRSRLTALDKAHGLVRTGNRSSGARGGFTSLEELAATLLRPYESAGDKNVVVDGDDVFVDGGIVTPLVLVFYELATNSTKCGALSDLGGAFGVHISRGIDERCIKWTERVAGATGYSDAADTGFGSKLLNLTINEQLQGSYAVPVQKTAWTSRSFCRASCLATFYLIPLSCHRQREIRLTAETSMGASV
jgi:two-component sensor histidine kinase